MDKYDVAIIIILESNQNSNVIRQTLNHVNVRYIRAKLPVIEPRETANLFLTVAEEHDFLL